MPVTAGIALFIAAIHIGTGSGISGVGDGCGSVGSSGIVMLQTVAS
ncbi:MAG TPA: hypothetical protein VMU99_03645 [Acidimicrobiales bacterium]|nr:hypothetical protein [Acidimicrobiales bacterium]